MRVERRWGSPRTTRRHLMAMGLAVLAPVGTGAAWPVRYRSRLYPGVAILGLDLGGLTRAEAMARMAARLDPFLQRPLTLRLDAHNWRPSAVDLGIRVDLSATLDQACRHGRGDGWLRRYMTLLHHGAVAGVPVVVTLDDAVLRGFLDRLDAEIARPPRDAHLVVNAAGAEIVPEQMGRRLDHVAVRKAVLTAITKLTSAEITVATRPVAPRVIGAQLDTVRDVVAAMVGAPVVVTLGDQHWTVTTEELTESLVVPVDLPGARPMLDRDILAARLAPIAEVINHPTRDATLAWDGGLYAVSEGYAGAEVDLEALITRVAAAAESEERVVELPLRFTPPTIAAANLDTLGITQLVATGSSSFVGSSEARARNVRVAAEHVSQTLISPGGTVSFNAALGPIAPEQGYVEGKIIAGDWYASDLGGGVCQVSTTVFRAALFAGLPFVEWHPHTFRLGFYELDGWPPGMDAAIYQPNTPDESELDLVFTNPTDGWLLLQVRVEGETVTAELYGPPTRREVEVLAPQLGKPIPPPAPSERLSEDLPRGDREQVQIAQPGVEVVMTRRIIQEGLLLAEDNFVSRYQPQADITLVGAVSS